MVDEKTLNDLMRHLSETVHELSSRIERLEFVASELLSCLDGEKWALLKLILRKEE